MLEGNGVWVSQQRSVRCSKTCLTFLRIPPLGFPRFLRKRLSVDNTDDFWRGESLRWEKLILHLIFLWERGIGATGGMICYSYSAILAICKI